MALRVNSGGTWTLVPEQPEKVWCNNGGVWTEARQIWVAEETTPGVYEWALAYDVPQPPAGVAITSIDQTMFLGGDVEAGWTNSTNDFSINVEWTINSVVWGIQTYSPATTLATLPEAELSNGDEVQARMRYFEGAVVGDWGTPSSVHTYNA
jgi:hypothetical protein